MSRHSISDVIRAIVSGLVALVLGLFGLALLFSDLGPGETLARRYTVTVLFNLVLGLVIGLVNPRAWLVAGLLAWGGILIALRGLFSGPWGWAGAFTVIGLSPLPAFSGGYLGALIIRKRVFQLLLRRG